MAFEMLTKARDVAVADSTGDPREGYRTRKFGSWERSPELDANVTAVGEKEGIHFAFDKIERTPHTVDAHRLIWLADQKDCQGAAVEALFQAYFTDALDMGNRQMLIDVAGEAGLTRHRVEIMLGGDDGKDMLSNAAEMTQRFGIDGVPFFVINQNLMLSVAQQSETFLEAFRQAMGMT